MPVLKNKNRNNHKKNPTLLSRGAFDGNGRRGKPDFGGPPEGVGITSPEFGLNDFQNMDLNSAEKTFLQPGDSHVNMAARSVFKYSELPDLRDIVLCIARYERFHQYRHLGMIMNLMAGAPAIGGLSRLEGMMAGSGMIDTGAVAKIIQARGGKASIPAKKENKPYHYPDKEEEVEE